MLQLKCTGLNLTSLNALSCAEGSIDVPVNIEFDSTYNGYTKSLSVGYYNENGIEQNVFVSQENEQFMIPGPVFAQSGIIFISVHFKKEGVKFEPETNAVNYFVTKTAGGSGNLGARYTWEPVVKSFVDQYLTNNPPIVVTDLTLTKSGQAADAKVVGDKISKLKEDIANNGGLNDNAKNLLITILRNAKFQNDQSENITSLESALSSTSSGDDNTSGEEGGDDSGTDEPIVPTPTTYTITNNLTNVSSDNANTSIEENTSYSANLSASEGYILDSVSVHMGGIDVTSTVYSDGVINISSVTGNIVITANGIEEQTTTVWTGEKIITEDDLGEQSKTPFGIFTSNPLTLSAGTYYLYSIYKTNSGVPSQLYHEIDGAFTEVTSTYATITRSGAFKTGVINEFGNESSDYYQPNGAGYFVEVKIVLSQDFTGYIRLGGTGQCYALTETGWTFLTTEQFNPYKQTLS